MFILSYMLIAVVIIYIGVAVYLHKLAVKHYPHKKLISKLVLAFFILLPTYDIIITNVLGGYYCLTTPDTFINKTVEYPESIYWEDNVYPGFNEEDRKLMIMNYLDGVHLKKMALNGDGGKVYIYEAEKSDWVELESLKYDSGKIYSETITNIANMIISKTEKIYTKQTMPKMNYTVTFNEVKLNSFVRKFLYSDETKITDNKTSKVLAYDMCFYSIYSKAVAKYYGVHFNPNPICGKRQKKAYDFFTYKNNNFSMHSVGLNIYLQNKKGEK